MARITTPEQLQHTLLGSAETSLVIRLGEMGVDAPYEVLQEVFESIHAMGFVQGVMSQNRSLSDDLTDARDELRRLNK